VDPSQIRHAQAWAIALIIVILVLALNVGARLIAARRAKMLS
jgi:ABC-type phosphate transport system permease subunit